MRDVDIRVGGPAMLRGMGCPHTPPGCGDDARELEGFISHGDAGGTVEGRFAVIDGRIGFGDKLRRSRGGTRGALRGTRGEEAGDASRRIAVLGVGIGRGLTREASSCEARECGG